MAVTQQLVRITIEDLLECSKSEDKLEKLISFKLNMPEDELDLNWAPKGLELYCEFSQQTLKVQSAIRMVFDGKHFVNDLCHDYVNGYKVDSDITMLLPDEVEVAYEGLKNIDWQSFKTCMPVDKNEALILLNIELVCHPNDYYIPKMRQLIDFVSGTVEKNMGIAQWWD